MRSLVAVMVLLVGSAGMTQAAVPIADGVELDAQVRARHEYYNHFYAPGAPDGENTFNLTRSRARLGINAKVGDKTRIIVQLQDIRLWGEGSTTEILGRTDLKLGEARISNILSEGDRLQFGRFEMKYGDERLVGALDWVDQGRSFDGVRLSYGPGDAYVDLFGVNNRETLNEDENQYFVGLYGGSRRKTGAGPGIDAYFLYLSDQRPMRGELGVGTSDFATVGARLSGTADAFQYSAEAVFQTGRTHGDDLTAWGFAGKVTYGETGADGLTVRVGVEFDAASGNDNLGDGKQENLQTLFPTNHKHYGYMDLIGWSNMMDLRGIAILGFSPQTTLEFSWHYLRLMTSEGGWVGVTGAWIRAGVEEGPTTLGNEVDLLFRWKATQGLGVGIGWSTFFPGAFVEETGPSPTSHFGYLQLSASV